MADSGGTEKKKGNIFMLYNFVMLCVGIILLVIGLIWLIFENFINNTFGEYWIFNLFPTFTIFFGIIIMFISLSIFKYGITKNIEDDSPKH